MHLRRWQAMCLWKPPYQTKELPKTAKNVRTHAIIPSYSIMQSYFDRFNKVCKKITVSCETIGTKRKFSVQNVCQFSDTFKWTWTFWNSTFRGRILCKKWMHDKNYNQLQIQWSPFLYRQTNTYTYRRDATIMSFQSVNNPHIIN